MKKRKTEEIVTILSRFPYMQHIKIKCFQWPDFAKAPEIQCEEIYCQNKAPLIPPRAVSSLLFLPPCHLYKCLCKCSAQHDRLHLLHPPDVLSEFSASVPSMNSLGECEVKKGVRSTAAGNCSPSVPDLFPLTPAS